MNRPFGLELIIILQTMVAIASFLIAIGFSLLLLEEFAEIVLLPNAVLPLFVWIAGLFYFIGWSELPTVSGLFENRVLLGSIGCIFFIFLALSTTWLTLGFRQLSTRSWRVMMSIQFFSVLFSFFGLFLDSAEYSEIYAGNLMIAIPLFCYFSRRHVKRAFNIKDPIFKMD